MVVVGAGTGGTVCGIGRKMKDKLPNVKVRVQAEQHPLPVYSLNVGKLI